MMEGYHRPVLLKEVLGALNIRDAWYLDCTLGDGGHSIEIIRRGGKVVGIDVDPQALGRVRKRFEEEGIDKSKFKLIQGNFRDIKNLLQTDIPDQKFAGAIFDLGVSSLQLETPQRGFSFTRLGPLDMRMDPDLEVRALDLLNAGRRKELNELFYRLGEEKYSKRLADALVSAREVRGKGKGVREKRIESTRDLAELVENVYRRVGIRQWRIHPATRVFQALRIAVNDELNALQEGLNQVIDLIQKNGRIVVLNFHSLEDRIVKNTFREWQEQGLGSVLTDKPIIPSADEIKSNPRARSAKLRVFEKE